MKINKSIIFISIFFICKTLNAFTGYEIIEKNKKMYPATANTKMEIKMSIYTQGLTMVREFITLTKQTNYDEGKRITIFTNPTKLKLLVLFRKKEDD